MRQSRMRQWIAATALPLASLMSLAGCQNQSATTKYEIEPKKDMARQAGDTAIPPVGDPREQTVDIDQMYNDNPTLTKLDRINTLLLVYFGLHKAMPATLQELQSIGQVDLAAPSSGQSYVYVPNGLRSSSSTKFVIAYDPSPLVDSKGHQVRYCIRLTPVEYGRAISTEVTKLYEQDFQAYHPDVH